MNPLAITPAFTGEIQIPEAALKERDAIISMSKQITGVSSREELEKAVAALRDLTGLEKITEAGREKEKRPFLDFGKLIDSFAKKFVTPVTEEKTRITVYVNDWQRKEAARKAAEERERERERRKAQEELEKAQRAIGTAKNEKQKLAAQLAAEEAALVKQAASIIVPANTPQGLATRVSFDFEITDAHKLIAKKPALFRWKPGAEEFHLDRAGLRQALNAATENEYTGWRPPEDTQSVVMSEYGVRVFVSVKTNVRS